MGVKHVHEEENFQFRSLSSETAAHLRQGVAMAEVGNHKNS